MRDKLPFLFYVVLLALVVMLVKIVYSMEDLVAFQRIVIISVVFITAIVLPMLLSGVSKCFIDDDDEVDEY